MHVSQNAPGVSRTLSLVVAIIAACVVPAVAQTNGGTTQMSPPERAFVVNMLQLSRAQVALATLVEQRTNNPDAAVSAEGTVAEWCAFRSHLATLAAAAGVPPPVALSATQQTMLARLQRTPSSEVIAESMKLERQADQMALEQMRAEGSTTNSQISQFIAYARPEITGYDHVIIGENWSGPIRTGSFGWGGPSRTAYSWSGPIRTGSYAWGGPSRTAYAWSGPIRTGSYAWK